MTESGNYPNHPIRTDREFAVGARAPLSIAAMRRPKDANRLPTISRPLLRWFTWYSRGYIRRHFHSLRVSRTNVPAGSSGLPVVLYCNHASWWDPLVCLVLKSEFFPDRRAFAPIDAKALDRYKMFRRLGFFGVEPGSRRGAVEFLRSAETILRDPNHMLALTPQGRFTDVRERPVFQAGLGHLATRVEHSLFVPMAIEFVFWEERLPEILVRFGEPLEIERQKAPAYGTANYSALFEQKMAETQEALAIQARGRDPDDFNMILHGGAGQGGIYDWWRALRSKSRGEIFTREHGVK